MFWPYKMETCFGVVEDVASNNIGVGVLLVEGDAEFIKDMEDLGSEASCFLFLGVE